MKPNKTYLDLPVYSHPGAAGDSSQERCTRRRPAWSIESRLLRTLINLFGEPSIRVKLWDGTVCYQPQQEEAAATLLIRDRKTLWRLFTNPNLHFGDDYSAGMIEVEGDLVEALEAIFRARGRNARSNALEQLLRKNLARRRGNSLKGSRKNIHHHYDLGNDFYQLWLDSEMAYTCAYFPTPDASLEAAQLAKMDHVCRKLELKPGEQVIEAGCGWGSLARHMALNYGVKVRAFNISHEQIAFAKERAQREGFADQVEYVEDDYRNITGSDYDAFVSVGMLEHVGVANYPTLGKVIDQVLSENGRGLIHSIGKNRCEPTSPWTEKRLFPGGYSPTLAEMMKIFQEPGFAVTDVENLRLHYARTLDHWLTRYEHNIDRVRQDFDEFFVRAWRLYLAAARASFTAGSLQLFQVVFTRPLKSDAAWTRAHLYSPGVATQE